MRRRAMCQKDGRCVMVDRKKELCISHTKEMRVHSIYGILFLFSNYFLMRESHLLLSYSNVHIQLCAIPQTTYMFSIGIL